MAEAKAREQVTLSRETIHNPDEPRHFMRIKPVKGQVRILFEDRVLAESNEALRVLEAGRDIYDPVFYLPFSAIRARLVATAKQTSCPLKGQASYFDLVSDQGSVEVAEIAWSYQETFDFAALLKNRVAFDAARVVIEERPAPASS